jgi:diguanylate cyclase (GGDEF)-like protein
VLYNSSALFIDTSGIQAVILGVGLVALLQEIDLGKLRLWVVNMEAGNLRAVLSQVVTDNFDGIIVVDENGLVEASSAQAAAILNIPPGTLTQSRVENSLPPDFSAALREAIARIRSGVSVSRPPAAECLYDRGGDLRILEYVVTPSQLKRRHGVWRRKLVDHYVACLTFRDITDERRLEQEMFRLARFSALTGLPNRNSLHEKLQQLKADDLGPRAAVMAIDIDRFRSINGTLGYDYGDRLVCAVAGRLTALSAEVKFVAHLGGDDFALVIAGWTDRAELAEIANLLVHGISQPYLIEMRRMSVSFSAGVYICPLPVQDPVEAVMMADNALLAAKQSGGGTCRFHEEAVTTKVSHRQAIEIDLWPAFDRGQFSISYQPQVDLLTETITGAEALLRWEHPTRGLISPADFIPIAEVTGMIVPLGQWVLEQACRDAALWNANCKVSVNVSARQLVSMGFVDQVERALQLSGLRRNLLELEITEGVLIDDAARALEVMRELNRRKIDLVIDDFGTGYSSLSYLSSFPFKKLKMDKSLVIGIEAKGASREIVRTILSLASVIKADVVAEGVETAEQAKILRLMGCRSGQGFHYGRPQSGGEFYRRIQLAVSLSAERSSEQRHAAV